MLMQQLQRKSIYNANAEARAVAVLAKAMMHVDTPLPVYYGHKRLGVMQGDWRNNRTLYRAAATTLTGLDTQARNGNRWRDTWFKNASSGPASVGIWYDWWSVNSDPPGGSYSGTANTSRKFDDTMVGSFWLGGNVSPSIKQVSMMAGMLTSAPGVIMLYDRCLAYDNCTFTSTLTTMTNTITMPRYATTDDGGCQIMCCAQSGTAAATGVLSLLDYKDDTSAVGASRIAPIQANHVDVLANTVGTISLTALGAPVVFPYSKNAGGGLGPFMHLNQNVRGARSIIDHQWSVADANTFCFSLVRPIAMLVIPETGVHYEVDYITGIVNFEHIRDGAHLTMAAFWGTTASNVTTGYIEIVWS